MSGFDWGDTPPDALRPISCGPLWIRPFVAEFPQGLTGIPEDRLLRLRIGGAFGTGLHPTTALCLERIGEDPPDEVLDVGTGSGILALAALKLGATRAIGTDTDPAALREAAENARINGLADRLRLLPRLPLVQSRFVVANLLAAPLRDLAPAIVRVLSPGGTLVLSGVRVEQAEGVARTYRNLGLRPAGEATLGDWIRLDFRPSW